MDVVQRQIRGTVICRRRAGHILGLAHQEGDGLRRFGSSHLIAKFLHVGRIVAHVHEDQAISIGLP